MKRANRVFPTSRRRTLAFLAASGVGWIAARHPAQAATPISCVVRPEQTEGPFFVDEKLNRSDIRSDPRSGAVAAGTPLALAFRVGALAGSDCAPLRGAQVDVWQSDAAGRYSDVGDRGVSAGGTAFLRGHQLTDAEGLARFVTIYPGGYEGRAVHIHFKIRTAARSGRRREFTSQLYFDDALTARVHAAEPYAGRGLALSNKQDWIFRQAGGSQLLLSPVAQAGGYAATFDIGLKLA